MPRLMRIHFSSLGHADARRLAVYGRMCQRHRFEVLEGLYPHCARAVLERHGEEGWAALVEAYYRAHPMRAAELNANGAHLPEFLTHYAPAKGLLSASDSSSAPAA